MLLGVLELPPAGVLHIHVTDVDLDGEIRELNVKAFLLQFECYGVRFPINLIAINDNTNALSYKGNKKITFKR